MAIRVGDGIAEESSSDNYDQVMFTQNVETVEAFSSCMVLVRVGRACTEGCFNVMAQALQTAGGSLLQGLTVQDTYTELGQGGGKAVMEVGNSTAHPQALWRGPQAGVVAVIQVSKPSMEAWLHEGGRPQGPHAPRLTVGQGHGGLFNGLGLGVVGFLASGAGRCCPPALGQVLQCVFVGPHRVGLCPLCWAHAGSDRWHSLWGRI